MWVANDYLTTFGVRVLHKNMMKNIHPADGGRIRHLGSVTSGVIFLYNVDVIYGISHFCVILA